MLLGVCTVNGTESGRLTGESMQARHIPDTRDARSFPATEARLAASAAPTYVAAGGHEVPEGVLAGVDEDLPDCMQAPSLHQIGAHLQGTNGLVMYMATCL